MDWNEKDDQRFWSKVNKKGPEQCWEWTAGKFKQGYGQFSLKGKTSYSHRLSAAMSGLDIEGLVVRHKCDNPSCVNPNHLEAGSYQDNMNDRSLRGRCNSQVGEAHHNSILNDDLVTEIRERVSKGETQTKIASELGVSTYTVNKVVLRKTWKHLK